MYKLCIYEYIKNIFHYLKSALKKNEYYSAIFELFENC